MLTSPPLDEASRRRLVAAALTLTEGMSLAPKRYERQLLARYEAGTLTLDEVIALLDRLQPIESKTITLLNPILP